MTEGEYYDPSYGTGPFSNQNKWEDASIDALQGTYKESFWDQDTSYWIPSTSGHDVDFIPQKNFTPY